MYQHIISLQEKPATTIGKERVSCEGVTIGARQSGNNIEKSPCNIDKET